MNLEIKFGGKMTCIIVMPQLSICNNLLVILVIYQRDLDHLEGPSKTHNLDNVDNVDNIFSYYSVLLNSAYNTILSCFKVITGWNNVDNVAKTSF